MNTNTRIGIGALIVIVVAVAIALTIAHAPHSVPSSTPVSQTQTTGSQPISTVLYSCDAGKTISAAYYQGTAAPATSPDQPPVPTGSVALSLSDGRSMTLSQTISADGARYANADGSFVFWSKGNAAMVEENNQQSSFTGCIMLAPEPTGSDLSQFFSSSAQGFSIRLPSLSVTSSSGTPSDGYTPDTSYQYQELGPGESINGTKFTIPASVAAGTNLSSDSYISVEQIPQATNCSASLFVMPGATVKSVTDNGTTYSVATTNDAGAGNRYDETVYAIPGTDPCIAVRYYIHYSAFENYPPGTVTQFDEAALVAQFDQIRQTLVISQ